MSRWDADGGGSTTIQEPVGYPYSGGSRVDFVHLSVEGPQLRRCYCNP